VTLLLFAGQKNTSQYSLPVKKNQICTLDPPTEEAKKQGLCPLKAPPLFKKDIYNMEG
jgi:hypothetical protein